MDELRPFKCVISQCMGNGYFYLLRDYYEERKASGTTSPAVSVMPVSVPATRTSARMQRRASDGIAVEKGGAATGANDDDAEKDNDDDAFAVEDAAALAFAVVAVVDDGGSELRTAVMRPTSLSMSHALSAVIRATSPHSVHAFSS